MLLTIRLMCACGVLLCFTQSEVSSVPLGSTQRQVSEPRVRPIMLRDASLTDALAIVSSETGLGVAVEEILKENLSDAPRPEVRFSAYIPAGTLSQTLDDICNRDGRYTWNVNRHMINIFPRNVVGDSTYFLNRRIGHLVYDKVADSSTAVFFTVKQLQGPLEQIAMMQTGGSMRFPRPLKADLSNMTVREAFNRIAEQFGEGHGWTLSGARRFRLIQFHAGMEAPDPTKVAVSR